MRPFIIFQWILRNQEFKKDTVDDITLTYYLILIILSVTTTFSSKYIFKQYKLGDHFGCNAKN